MRRAAAGFTYMGLIFLLAILAISLSALAIVWHMEAQRERETELLFIGSEFRRAIAAYYEAGPADAKQFPRRLEDLVRDPRHGGTRRYLRKIYLDPMTGSDEWGLLKDAAGGISGVYSRSEKTPIKRANFAFGSLTFEQAKRYSDWIFAYGAPGGTVAAAAVAPAARSNASSTAPAAASPAPPSPQSSQCAAQLANDRTACAAAAQQLGEQVGFICQAHIPARLAACMQKRPLPPLPAKP